MTAVLTGAEATGAGATFDLSSGFMVRLTPIFVSGLAPESSGRGGKDVAVALATARTAAAEMASVVAGVTTEAGFTEDGCAAEVAIGLGATTRFLVAPAGEACFLVGAFLAFAVAAVALRLAAGEDGAGAARFLVPVAGLVAG